MERFGPLHGHGVRLRQGNGPLVILLHGFGAPGTDLVPLAGELGLPDAFRFLFLQAPLSLPMPYGDGRAWWMIDVGRFERAVATGELESLERENPNGLTEARSQLQQAIEAVDRSLGAPDLILGGFSQGSMLALDWALHHPRSLKALVLLSSTLIHRDAWVSRMHGRRGLPVFQSHGEHDPILPFSQAEKLRSAMEKGGLDVTWHPFAGQHQIPREVLQHLQPFLMGATS